MVTSYLSLARRKQFVDQGRVFASYDNALANVPFLIQMIYAVCLMAKSDVAAKVFSLMLAVNTALAIYAFAHRFFTRRIAAMHCLSFSLREWWLKVSVTTRIDVSLAGMLFAATYAMIIFLETDQRKWLWVSAILAGFSLGLNTLLHCGWSL
jgi:predicted membrane-bound mannosyltransferase